MCMSRLFQTLWFTWGFIGGKAGVDIRDNTCQCLCILAISISQTLDNVHHDV